MELRRVAFNTFLFVRVMTSVVALVFVAPLVLQFGTVTHILRFNFDHETLAASALGTVICVFTFLFSYVVEVVQKIILKYVLPR